MRLFVALPIPKECRQHIAKAALALEGCLGVRMVAEENWHITLKFIGETSPDEAKKAGQALEKVKFSPFLVRLFGAGAYPSRHCPRAIWIGGKSEGAEALAARIEEALAFLGTRQERFSLHVTVARSKGAADIESFISKASSLGEICSFEAKAFCLMKSVLGVQGASYEVLREYRAYE